MKYSFGIYKIVGRYVQDTSKVRPRYREASQKEQAAIN